MSACSLDRARRVAIVIALALAVTCATRGGIAIEATRALARARAGAATAAATRDETNERRDWRKPARESDVHWENGNVEMKRRATTSCASGEVREISREAYEREKTDATFEVVVAGYEYVKDFHTHYIWDIHIPNLKIVVYRRENPEIEARAWRGRCDMFGEERLLFPNRGRDASAFWDYALWKYDSPPRAVAFLHGHVAQAWHTSCEAIFTRVHAYERAMRALDGFTPVPNSLVTLTDPHQGRQHYEGPLWWFGTQVNGVRETHPETEAKEGSCQEVLATLNITLSNVDVTSCCGSFILPGAWIRGHARVVYETLLKTVLDETKDDTLTARQCFEFIVYALFSPKFLQAGFARDEKFNRNGLIQWFRNARALQDELRPLMLRCKAS